MTDNTQSDSDKLKAFLAARKQKQEAVNNQPQPEPASQQKPQQKPREQFEPDTQHSTEAQNSSNDFIGNIKEQVIPSHTDKTLEQELTSQTNQSNDEYLSPPPVDNTQSETIETNYAAKMVDDNNSNASNSTDTVNTDMHNSNINTDNNVSIDNNDTDGSESDVNSDDRLRDYLAKRKAANVSDEIDPNDPYADDLMARQYLKHLQKYLDRPDIESIKEIVINRPNEVGLEFVDGHWEWIQDVDLTMEMLEDISRMLANRSGQLFHPGNPMLSVKMPGGHRVQIVAGFNAPSGFIMAIRLQRREKFGLTDFDISAKDLKIVTDAVKGKKTLLLSGGTGTGKTSFMNALIPHIPEDERLISMEDVPELRIPHKNWAQMVFAGNDTTVGDQGVIDLLNACLRLRPDRIILGEIRKENAFAFCSAINTGHEGSMATIHANSPKMALDAVINRVLMNGDMPESAMKVLYRQIIEDIYGVVQLTKAGKGVKASFMILNKDDFKDR